MITKNKIKELVFKVGGELGLLEAPISVHWVATHFCNLNCQHCMVDAGKALKNELETDEVKSLINEIALMGVKNFSVTGGEALLRKDIFEVLAYAKSKKLKLGLATNSTLVDKYKNELMQLQLDSVMVSLDGLEENHQKIRGVNDNFHEVIKAIKFFDKIKVPTVCVCTVVNQLNINELDKIRDLIFSVGANYWTINITLPEGRAKNKDWLYLNREQTLGLFHFIEKNNKKHKIGFCSAAGYLGEWDKKIRGETFFCSCGWTSATIMGNGDVMGCLVFDADDFVEGNIREKSFKQIWDEGLNKFRNMPMQEGCNTCSYAAQCRGGCKVMRILRANCLREVWGK